RSVQNDPGWVFWTRFNTDVRLTFVGPQGLVTRSVAGDFGDPILDGIVGSPQALAPFGNLPLGTTVLIKAKPGVDPHLLSVHRRPASAWVSPWRGGRGDRDRDDPDDDGRGSGWDRHGPRRRLHLSERHHLDLAVRPRPREPGRHAGVDLRGRAPDHVRSGAGG